MNVEFTYEVRVIVDEDSGVDVEKALLEAAKRFTSEASVDETEAVELDDEE